MAWCKYEKCERYSKEWVDRRGETRRKCHYTGFGCWRGHFDMIKEIFQIWRETKRETGVEKK